MEKANEIAGNAKANKVNNNVEDDMQVQSSKLHKQMMLPKNKNRN